MKQRLLVAGLVLAGLAVMAPTASALLIRARVMSSHALVDMDGRWMPRFHVYFIGDAMAEDTCVMVLRDTDSGQMQMTSIAAASCHIGR